MTFANLKMASIGGITETIARMSEMTVSISTAVEQQGGATREIAPQHSVGGRSPVNFAPGSGVSQEGRHVGPGCWQIRATNLQQVDAVEVRGERL